MGIQAHVLVANPEADVVGLVLGRGYAQKAGEECFGASDVRDGVDDRLDALIHGASVKLIESRPLL
jgi:hypothetical protein